jgi:Domain of unknown function (DUF4920)
MVFNYTMKAAFLLLTILFSLPLFAQKHTSLPHGMVYGTKPDTLDMIKASQLDSFMDQKVRISTTIKGKITKVIKSKGGWFQLDAGGGKVISAHFKNYNVNIPAGLKGRTVTIEGVAQRQFIADDQQHFAGDTVSGKKQQNVKANPKHRLTFEIKGLMVE